MKKKRVTIYNVEYWKNKGFNDIESLEKVERCKKENSCWNKEFWIKKGFSEADSIEKVKEIQRKNNKKRTKESYKKQLNPYQTEYWEAKGFNGDEILKKINEHKLKTNPYLVLTEEEQISMIENRKITYYSKPKNERKEINKSRGLTKEQFVEKYGEDEYDIVLRNRTKHFNKDIFIENFGEEKYNDWRKNQLQSLMSRKFLKYSKVSIKLFKEIDNQINSVCYYGKNEKNVRFVKDGEHFIYYVDFLCNNSIIEFYGDYWHGNPQIYNGDDSISSKYKTLKVDEKWNKDKERIDLLKEQGYNVKIVWESDFKNDKNKVIKECVKWIKNL